MLIYRCMWCNVLIWNVFGISQNKYLTKLWMKPNDGTLFSQQNLLYL